MLAHALTPPTAATPPPISVVIPSYARAHNLPTGLCSLLKYEPLRRAGSEVVVAHGSARSRNASASSDAAVDRCAGAGASSARLRHLDLVALNARRLAASLPPVPMDRFRPNVVVSGCAPFEEDTWCAINFGAQATQLITEYPCPRCTVPNVDQATGTVDPPAVAPMRTLRDFRVRGGAVNFGVYLRPTGDLGTLKVGDALTVQPC